MIPFALPAFQETTTYLERENNTASVYTAENATERLYNAYASLLLSLGFEKKEEWVRGKNQYAAFLKDSTGVFLSFFGSLAELRLVYEEDCSYFNFKDASYPTSTPPQISQIPLEDFGLCYLIRLGDGRFVILDGGCGFEPDIDRLYAHLSKHTLQERPVIAAWILSHPHGDHYRAFAPFMKKYSGDIVLQKVLFNFPEADDLVHYPRLSKNDARFSFPTAPSVNLPIMHDLIRQSGAEVYMLHTGQTYRIGDATFEVLSCMDDTIHKETNINAVSVALRMTLAGQVTLWCTDVGMSFTRLPERYGDYLKADILQIPHHGFQCGTPEAEIAAYDLIRPEICLLPVSEYNAFTRHCTFREGTRHIMRDLGVREMITGEENRTLVLPYHAPDFAQTTLKRRFEQGLENNGARTWIFSGLCTADPEDFTFTLLNATNFDTTVWIEMYFENRAQTVQNIQYLLASMSVKQLTITEDEVDHDACYFNWNSIAKKGIPQNVPFAVRFLSDSPIVVTHKNHTASYHTGT